MILFNKLLLDKYLTNDVIIQKLGCASKSDAGFLSHKWLLNSPPKRMIYFYVYNNLLQPNKSKKKILDVGGGFCYLTKLMLQYHEYTLLDIMVHDNHSDLFNLEKSINRSFWQNVDWYDFLSEPFYDIVIANDLFCNVDQRLELFLEKFLPVCKEIWVTLTFHNTPRYYIVKRVDAEEIMTVIAFDGVRVKQSLDKFSDHLIDPDFDLFSEKNDSLFSNNRQVVLVKFKGAKY